MRAASSSALSHNKAAATMTTLCAPCRPRQSRRPAVTTMPPSSTTSSGRRAVRSRRMRAATAMRGSGENDSSRRTFRHRAVRCCSRRRRPHGARERHARPGFFTCLAEPLQRPIPLPCGLELLSAFRRFRHHPTRIHIVRGIDHLPFSTFAGQVDVDKRPHSIRYSALRDDARVCSDPSAGFAMR